jgi:hypothetical protein
LVDGLSATGGGIANDDDTCNRIVCSSFGKHVKRCR